MKTVFPKQTHFFFSIRQELFLFGLLLFILFLITGVVQAIGKVPCGVHFIRQSDNLAFSSNYFLFDYSFFEPHVFNLSSTDGKAACEFPILYYITSLFYRIFGEQYWVLRLINFIITYAGVIALYRSSRYYVKHAVMAAILSFITITSTVFLYYASNYLVDTSALGLSFIGLYAAQNFSISKNDRSLTLAVLSFTLACLLKITFGILPLAILCSYVLESVVEKKRIVLPKWPRLLFYMIVVGSIPVWYQFADSYNTRSGDTYFLTSVVPFWKLSSLEIAQTWNAISQYWDSSYYKGSSRLFILVCFLIVLMRMKHLDRRLLFTLLFGFMGSCCYILLFFGQFKNHDYYFLPLVPFAALLLFAAGSQIIYISHDWFKWIIVGGTFSIFISASIYCEQKVEKRYTRGSDKYDIAAYTLSPSMNLAENVTTIEDKILVIGDGTKNGSLMFLKRKGYSAANCQEFNGYVNREKILEESDFIYLLKSCSIDSLQTHAVEHWDLGSWKVYRILH